MIVQVHTDPAGLALLLAALVRINVHDCSRDPALLEDLRRRCSAAPGVGFRYKPDATFLAPRWSTFAVLAGRAKGGPIEDDSTGIAAAYAAALLLFQPGRQVSVCSSGARKAALHVDDRPFDPATMHGAPAHVEGSAGSGCAVVDAAADQLSYTRTIGMRTRSMERIRADLLVEVSTDIHGLTLLLGYLTLVNIHDCSRWSSLADDLRRRCYASAKQGFVYHRDPPYLPDRWTTFAVASEDTAPDDPLEDDCEGLAGNYAAGLALFEPGRVAEVCIAQPGPGRMAHAFNRVDGGLFDGSTFNGMTSPPPDFYESGERTCIRLEKA